MKILFIVCSLFFGLSFSQGQEIWIMGDSITQGYGVEEKDTYVVQLQELLHQQQKKVQIKSLGVSGATTASMISRVKQFKAPYPKYILIALGGNDVLRGIPANSTQQNFKVMIAELQKRGITVWIAPMQAPINSGETYLRQFNQLYFDLAKEHQIKLTPFLLEGVGANPLMNIEDGIHPNEKGHQQIAKNLLPFVLKQLP